MVRKACSPSFLSALFASTDADGLDEQVFRFNSRKTKDVARFIDALRGIVGHRLTYDDLTGATATT